MRKPPWPQLTFDYTEWFLIQWKLWKPSSAEDRAKDVGDLELRLDNFSLPAQRSLGVFCDLETDAFRVKVSLPEKPFTRRGVLSIVNPVYDPLGFAVPVMLEGRKILQHLVHMGQGIKENNAP